VAVVGAIVFLCASVPRWLRMGSLDQASLTPARAWVDMNLPKLPLFGEMHIRHNLRDFFESLALMLDAGVPLIDALPYALSTVTNCLLHQELAEILPRIKQGDPLSKAIADLSFVNGSDLLSFVKTGEATARLPEMLFKYAAEESAALESFHRQVATWAPRLVYGVIAIWLGYGLLYGFSHGTA
jgi:general secretion pathway protein F